MGLGCALCAADARTGTQFISRRPRNGRGRQTPLYTLTHGRRQHSSGRWCGKRRCERRHAPPRSTTQRLLQPSRLAAEARRVSEALASSARRARDAAAKWSRAALNQFPSGRLCTLAGATAPSCHRAAAAAAGSLCPRGSPRMWSKAGGSSAWHPQRNVLGPRSLGPWGSLWAPRMPGIGPV